MEGYSFNIIEEPWIPCQMKSSEFRLLGIKEALFNASKIADIDSENPLVKISLYRLLLAILHRNFGPKNEREWIELYNNGQFYNETLQKYFDEWFDKFELFNEPDLRFYQIEVPDKDPDTPITKLNHALSSGNNTALFDHTWDSDAPALSIENAVQLLVAFQNFALGGGRSEPFNYSSAPLISSIIVLLKGDSLFETLMLNLTQYDEHHPFEQLKEGNDIPFWERSEKSLCEEKKGRIPNGYLDYLTWQSRRIILVPEDHNGNIRVRFISISQGEKVSDEWNYDPQKVYILDKKKNTRSTLQIRGDRKVWRDAESILKLSKESNNIPPLALNWISELVDRGTLPTSKQYSLEIFGLNSNRAKVDDWHHSSIPLPVKFLKDQSLVSNVQLFIKKCEKIEKSLKSTLKSFAKEYLFPENDSLSRNQWDKINEFIDNLQISIRYWNAIEYYFYKMITDIAAEPDYEKRIIIINSIINAFVVKTAKNLLDSLKINMKHDPRALKPLVQKLGSFFGKIKDITY